MAELDTAERQIAETFVGRVMRYKSSPVEQKWLAGVGDTLGSPLPEPPASSSGAGTLLRLKEFLLSSISRSSSSASGGGQQDPSDQQRDELLGAGGRNGDDDGDGACREVGMIKVEAVLMFLQEHNLVYQSEMDDYRAAIDVERQRQLALDARLRLVKDEGEAIECEGRSQSRAAIALLTPRPSAAGTTSTRSSTGGSDSMVGSAAESPAERVVELLSRQHAIHESLAASTQQQPVARPVPPTVQRLDMTKVNRVAGRR
jgi:hypothetical protein